MSRKVFFSFHYQNDVWRANQVRNSWVTKDRESAGFIDKAEFEKIKQNGSLAVQNWIDNQLKGTSVTVVLIGAETNSRGYVQYEMLQSNLRGNGIVAIHIHKLQDSTGKRSIKGSSSFGKVFKDRFGNSKYFHELYETYDWVDDNGYLNLGNWVEKAAQNAGK